ncbi:hypothetical protein [Myxosarcina sp. GI1]|uniref:hypothetical protein n=1 Tax=Myxosarcina sp. GI1 TaxID=1541065 RepID=UPI0012E0AE0C|nr:hypothetical protein [Myxosarcina sp. GI1]
MHESLLTTLAKGKRLKVNGQRKYSSLYPSPFTFDRLTALKNDYLERLGCVTILVSSSVFSWLIGIVRVYA